MSYQNDTLQTDEEAAPTQSATRQSAVIGKFAFLAFAVLGLVYISKLEDNTIEVPETDLSHFDQASDEGYIKFVHFSDTHIDPFFDPTESMAHGICHSCRLNAANPDFFCPNANLPHTSVDDVVLENDGYAFGRYSCNPPARLFFSFLDLFQ